MSRASDSAITFVLSPQIEGGYANHPADKGGPTNMGVTQAAYDRWRTRHHLPIRSVRDITETEARTLYYEDYWVPSGAEGLLWPVQLIHFDTYVNSPPLVARKLLEESGGNPVTYLRLREENYRAIVRRDPTQGVFLNGWLNRVKTLKAAIAIPIVAILLLAGAVYLWGRT